jgi:hypothetical protein
MKLAMLGCLLVSLTPLTTEARRFSPGAAFTATLQSETTNATATMTWVTSRTCDQGPLVFQFQCLGRWQCDGAACPGRRGRLMFTFDPKGFHDVLLRVSPRSVCSAHFVGAAQGPQSPPYHWIYQCFTIDPTTQIDSGTAVVELKPAP